MVVIAEDLVTQETLFKVDFQPFSISSNHGCNYQSTNLDEQMIIDKIKF